IVHCSETFEKRAIGHCEEAKGRRSNPISYCIDEIASGGSPRNDCVGLLCRSAPRNDREGRNSKVSLCKSVDGFSVSSRPSTAQE
ncbi:MAG: hypothetical protein KJ649_08250, partial [Proteobacteria bacterium]|nr:hypothetical protein [Pseudomonadota bacterium]